MSEITKEMVERATRVLIERIPTVLNFGDKACAFRIMPGIEDIARSILVLSHSTGLSADGWQPIETAPKDGTHIWVYVPAGNYAGCHEDWWETKNRSDGEWWKSAATNPPTHWYPLPPLPTAQPTEKKP